MLHVGLTGNIACGKSSAASFFADLGARVIDADRIGHELLRPGTPTHRKIVEVFGRGILSPENVIDRKILGKIVFDDADRRALLNSIIHPDIDAEIRQRIEAIERSATEGIIIVDAALMIETGNHSMYECLIVVFCDPSLQIRRLMQRDGLTETEARLRIASQMPIEEKLKLADYRIDTSGTMLQTRLQVESIYRELQNRRSSGVRGIGVRETRN